MPKAKMKAVASQDLFEQLKAELSRWHIISTARAAGVTPSTLYFWLDGTTQLPRLDTIVRVAEAVGLTLVLQKSGRTRLHAVK